MPPIYDFFCEKCDLEKEIIQSIKEYTGKESCDQCGNPMDRIYTYCSFYHVGAKVEDAEFNVGLGKITKSAAHRKELAKRMGVEEIGNDSPEKIHKKFDTEREVKRNKKWDEV